jgi:hypothetical protein
MPKGMSFFGFVHAMSESKMQLFIILLGLIFVVFSFFLVFDEQESEQKPVSHLECMSQAKVLKAKRSAQICSARYKEKLSCYLKGSIQQCEEIFPQTFISGCTLPDDIITQERSHYMTQMKVCNENFND